MTDRLRPLTVCVLLALTLPLLGQTQADVDELAETARRLRDQARAIKDEASAAGRGDVAERARIVQRAGELAVTARVHLDAAVDAPATRPADGHTDADTGEPWAIPDAARVVRVPDEGGWLQPGRGTADEPLVYRPGADQGRAAVPKIVPDWGATIEHVWFVGLEIREMDLRAMQGTVIRHITFVDCTFPAADSNPDIQGATGVRFLRCTFGPRAAGRFQGLFAKDVDGLVVAQSVFDRVGTANGPETSDLGHGLYLTDCTGVRIRDNTFVRGGLSVKLNASEPGAIADVRIERNTWVRCAKAVIMGSNAGADLGIDGVLVARNTVLTSGRTIYRGEDPSNRPISIAGALTLDSARNVTVRDNVFARNRSTDMVMDATGGPYENVGVGPNVVVEWQPSENRGLWPRDQTGITIAPDSLH